LTGEHIDYKIGGKCSSPESRCPKSWT
jgi:hypothetical protein